MIQLNDLSKKLTEVTDSDLGLVVGGGIYDLNYQANQISGINTGNIAIGIGSTNLGYSFANMGRNALSATYSVSTPIGSNVTLGANYEGVSKSVGIDVGYKSNNFKANVFANPSSIGFGLSGSF